MTDVSIPQGRLAAVRGRERQGFDERQRVVIGQIRLERRHRHVAVLNRLPIGAIVGLPVVLRFFDPEVRPLARIEPAIDFVMWLRLACTVTRHALRRALRDVDVQERAGRQRRSRSAAASVGRRRGAARSATRLA